MGTAGVAVLNEATGGGKAIDGRTVAVTANWLGGCETDGGRSIGKGGETTTEIPVAGNCREADTEGGRVMEGPRAKTGSADVKRELGTADVITAHVSDPAVKRTGVKKNNAPEVLDGETRDAGVDDTARANLGPASTVAHLDGVNGRWDAIQRTMDRTAVKLPARREQYPRLSLTQSECARRPCSFASFR